MVDATVKRRANDGAIELSNIISTLVAIALGSLLLGWLPMLGLGVLHSRYPIVPVFGYFECVALILAIRITVRLVVMPPNRTEPKKPVAPGRTTG